METTERIVEAYVRYVKGWATIPNVRCAGQNEIDLVAIDPLSLAHYHIETSISISQGFRKLTAKTFDPQKVKERVHQASQRRTVGFFVERKFNAPTVVERLTKLGFEPGQYGRIIVTWGWEDAAASEAAAAGIELWDFREIVREIADLIKGSREYFSDDTLRTLNLFIHATDEAERAAPRTASRPPSRDAYAPAASRNGGFWVYDNWTHDYAAVHYASCSFCADGRGTQSSTSRAHGQWLGPFPSGAQAWAEAEATGRRDVRPCRVCAPVKSD